MLKTPSTSWRRAVLALLSTAFFSHASFRNLAFDWIREHLITTQTVQEGVVSPTVWCTCAVAVPEQYLRVHQEREWIRYEIAHASLA